MPIKPVCPESNKLPLKGWMNYGYDDAFMMRGLDAMVTNPRVRTHISRNVVAGWLAGIKELA